MITTSKVSHSIVHFLRGQGISIIIVCAVLTTYAMAQDQAPKLQSFEKNILSVQVGYYKLDGWSDFTLGFSGAYGRSILPWLSVVASGRYWQSSDMEIWNNRKIVNPPGAIGNINTATAAGRPPFLYSFAQVEAGVIINPFKEEGTAPLSDLRLGAGLSYRWLASFFTSYAQIIPYFDNETVLFIANTYTQQRQPGIWFSVGYGFPLGERVTLGVDATYHDYLRSGYSVTFYGIASTLSVGF